MKVGLPGTSWADRSYVSRASSRAKGCTWAWAVRVVAGCGAVQSRNALDPVKGVTYVSLATAVWHGHINFIAGSGESLEGDKGMTNPWFRGFRAARTLGVLLGGAVVLGALPAVTGPATAVGSTPPASAEEAAFVLAAETGEPVEIIQQRTEDELVFANPDGSLTSETSVQPQRVERPDGTWVKADATLEWG